jgi:hypothetical protein
VKPLRAGQCVQHDRYGVGITRESNENKTTIDFYEHGPKLFVTELLSVELVAEAPPRPPRKRVKAQTAKD